MCNKLLLIVLTTYKTLPKYLIKELSCMMISALVGTFSIDYLYVLSTYSLTDPTARIYVTFHP